MSHAPLHGLRVVELARILAGPWAGQTLADLGAEVVKIEAPEGDDTRKWGPPFIDRGDDKAAGYFHSCNRGKKSVIIDFRTPEGKADLLGLISEADVLIENFKVGGLAKYGLDYDSLKDANPRLIYCSITGFGQTGPYAPRAGYDFLMQGMSGLMSVTGEIGGEPQKYGVAVTDVFTGLYSVIAIQAALAYREKTGRGQQIDMALLDVAAAVTANQGFNTLATGKAPGLTGNAHVNIVPYQVFPTSDGHVIVTCGNNGQYSRFCDVLGRPDLATHEDFDTNPKRVTNRDTLVPILRSETVKHTKAEILAACEANVVPAGPINDMNELFADPHVQSRGMQMELEGLPAIRSPMRFSESPLAMETAAPKLGAHTDEVLKKS
ncbi:CaiB/BaiF CoA-transferase family protein [Amylibacter sp. IMCC11727]|uniref:CaiB/BaiF CoA transferase family protein n=1 Tax=Amylibacter sp. IMCC11727 TaxID=3039851 RepID=UPI00244DEF22|nr:CaiB/BaiF CoA-transferase family protein [Amylibacter sp. IMCC11727]WGI22277.1 CaiB/BaiF CoA-transferase family protein [Amylibacter sp. IMCC11727]